MHYRARLFLVVQERTDSVHSAHVIPSSFYYLAAMLRAQLRGLMVLLHSGFVIAR
jgi:hypothetical protein